MHVRKLTVEILALALVGAASSAFAQQAPTPEARAQAAEAQRRQDALPDTPGTGRYAALKEIDPLLAEHVIYRPANLEALGGTKLGV